MNREPNFDKNALVKQGRPTRPTREGFNPDLLHQALRFNEEGAVELDRDAFSAELLNLESFATLIESHANDIKIECDEIEDLVCTFHIFIDQLRRIAHTYREYGER